MDFKNTLEFALHYLDLGFSIIPISPDKKPLIEWKKYQKQKATREEIENWFSKSPSINIGIVTGEISGIVVIDIEYGGETGNLPPTVISKTGGGGYHFFYKYPGVKVKNGVRVRELTDIRGDGGYVVVPPSLHTSGNNYEWVVSPDDAEFGELPHWVIEQTANSIKHKEPTDWEKFVQTGNSEGTRNMNAAQLAGKLLYHSVPEFWEILAWPMLQDWNQKQNNPPLPESELRATWESIKKAETKKRLGEQKPEIDVSKFKPLMSEDLIKILGNTIKKDDENKIIAFLSELAAYTDNSQFNIIFNAPSSAGKSYIATEIARLFPPADIKEIAYCSPTAFFHDEGTYSKQLEGYVVNLARKIIIFLDQPHQQLLERLRPLLSHDKKEIRLKITDKGQKHGLRTKNIVLLGYPSVIFCTANLQTDEQESTRFFLLSPDIDQEKIREGIYQKVRKEADNEAFQSWLDEIPERKELRDRIYAIREENIQEIRIANYEEITEKFLERNHYLKPRHQRDIARLLSLIKSLALLNLWWRNKDGSTITANEDDIQEAFRIWDKISIPQDLNIPPFVYKIHSSSLGGKNKNLGWIYSW